MSYCRWSSDNWKCDLYCYADSTGGWTTHVASNRIVVELPELPEFTPETSEEYFKVHAEQSKLLDDCKRVSIGLEFDGDSFNDSTIEDFRDRLIMLREAGYSFPDYVLERVQEEIEASR